MLTTSPTLHVIRGRNSHCGPAVISALVGCSTDEAAESLRQVLGRVRILGTPAWALSEVLDRHGISMGRNEVFVDGGPPFREWVPGRSGNYPKTIFVVGVGTHICVVHNRYLYDCTHRVPWHLTEKRLSTMTKRVVASWIIEKKVEKKNG